MSRATRPLRGFRNLTFRAQLVVLLILFTMLTVGSVSILMSLMATDLFRDRAWSDQERVVKQTVANLDRAIRSVEDAHLTFSSNRSVILGLADLDSVDNFASSVAVRRIKDLMFAFTTYVDGMEAVMFISRDGDIVSSLGGRFVPDFLDPDDTQGRKVSLWLEEDPRRFMWYIDGERDNAEVFFVRSFFHSDTLENLGLLAYVIDSDVYRNLISGLAVPGGGVFIADSTGRPFVYPGGSSANLPLLVSDDTDSPVLSESKHSFRISSSLRNGWYFVLDIPKDELYRNIDAIGITGGIIAILCIVLGVTAAIVLSRWYASDLSALVNSMKVSSGGNLESLVNVGRTREFRDLAGTYNQLLDSLDTVASELKEEVARKTAAEAALLELNETLELKVSERTNQLRESLEQLRLTQSHLIESEKMASLGSMVAGMAHELNTPLGTSITAVSYLADRIEEMVRAGTNCDEDDWRDFTNVAGELTGSMLKNLQRLSILVSDFKQVSVDQSEDFKKQFSMFDSLNAVIGSLKPSYSNLTTEVECNELLYVESYPGVYNIIFTNLIANAGIHAYPDGASGPVRVAVAADDETITIKVEDQGVGMDDETQNRVFEPFYTTRRNRGGTGLGLHIVYNLVTQKLGGRISCYSRPGRGTRFELLIPRTVPEFLEPVV